MREDHGPPCVPKRVPPLTLENEITFKYIIHYHDHNIVSNPPMTSPKNKKKNKNFCEPKKI